MCVDRQRRWLTVYKRKKDPFSGSTDDRITKVSNASNEKKEQKKNSRTKIVPGGIKKEKKKHVQWWCIHINLSPIRPFDPYVPIYIWTSVDISDIFFFFFSAQNTALESQKTCRKKYYGKIKVTGKKCFAEGKRKL